MGGITTGSLRELLTWKSAEVLVEGNEVSLNVPGPGEYRVQAVLYAANGSQTVLTCRPASIQVEQTDTEQSFAVTIAKEKDRQRP